MLYFTLSPVSKGSTKLVSLLSEIIEPPKFSRNFVLETTFPSALNTFLSYVTLTLDLSFTFNFKSQTEKENKDVNSQMLKVARKVNSLAYPAEVAVGAAGLCIPARNSWKWWI